jgi:hypothetical protein
MFKFIIEQDPSDSEDKVEELTLGLQKELKDLEGVPISREPKAKEHLPGARGEPYFYNDFYR